MTSSTHRFAPSASEPVTVRVDYYDSFKDEVSFRIYAAGHELDVTLSGAVGRELKQKLAWAFEQHDVAAAQQETSEVPAEAQQVRDGLTTEW